MPQADWLTGADGAVLPVERILRLEALEHDLRSFLLAIGVPTKVVEGLSLPLANASDWPRDAGTMSARSRDLLRDRYAMDFERFGYQ